MKGNFPLSFVAALALRGFSAVEHAELRIIGRGGLYEMTAFILVAVATYNQSRFALTKEMHSLKDLHRIDPVPRMSLEQWVGVGLAITLILFAGWREAGVIMAL